MNKSLLLNTGSIVFRVFQCLPQCVLGGFRMFKASSCESRQPTLEPWYWDRRYGSSSLMEARKHTTFLSSTSELFHLILWGFMPICYTLQAKQWSTNVTISPECLPYPAEYSQGTRGSLENQVESKYAQVHKFRGTLNYATPISAKRTIRSLRANQTNLVSGFLFWREVNEVCVKNGY